MKTYCLFISILFIALFANVSALSQDNRFSNEEKLEDFNELYNVLKENYMYFEVNQRLHGVDWPGNY